VHCGIKSNPTKPDLALVVTDAPAVAAGRVEPQPYPEPGNSCGGDQLGKR
jgi:hypothetical protein